MKKIALLAALATLATIGTASAQTPTPSAAEAGDRHSGDLLNAHRPTPPPSAAPGKGDGKKMVGELMLSTDEKGKNTTDSFPTTTPTIYLMTKNVSGAKGDKVIVEWFVDDAGKELPKNKRFYSSSVALPDTATYNPSFNVTGPIKGKFPMGKYHVDVAVGGQKLKSMKFTVH